MENNQLESTLKKQGHRNTKARRLVFEILNSSDCSMSPKEIFTQIEDESGVDLVSIYRNLDLFVELGLVHRFQDGRFSSCHHDHSQHKGDHLHFISICVECGKKAEIPHHSKSLCDLGRKIKKACTELQTFNDVIIQGRCPRC